METQTEMPFLLFHGIYCGLSVPCQVTVETAGTASIICSGCTRCSCGLCVCVCGCVWRELVGCLIASPDFFLLIADFLFIDSRTCTPQDHHLYTSCFKKGKSTCTFVLLLMSISSLMVILFRSGHEQNETKPSQYRQMNQIIPSMIFQD